LVQKVFFLLLFFSPPRGRYVVAVIGCLQAFITTTVSNNWETDVADGFQANQ